MSRLRGKIERIWTKGGGRDGDDNATFVIRDAQRGGTAPFANTPDTLVNPDSNLLAGDEVEYNLVDGVLDCLGSNMPQRCQVAVLVAPLPRHGYISSFDENDSSVGYMTTSNDGEKLLFFRGDVAALPPDAPALQIGDLMQFADMVQRGNGRPQKGKGKGGRLAKGIARVKTKQEENSEQKPLTKYVPLRVRMQLAKLEEEKKQRESEAANGGGAEEKTGGADEKELFESSTEALVGTTRMSRGPAKDKDGQFVKGFTPESFVARNSQLSRDAKVFVMPN